MIYSRNGDNMWKVSSEMFSMCTRRDVTRASHKIYRLELYISLPTDRNLDWSVGTAQKGLGEC